MMKLCLNYLLKFAIIILFIVFFYPRISISSDLIPIQTSSTGYQPRLQVSGNKIYFVWHDYDGPSRQIFTGEMSLEGTGWKSEKRTKGKYDKTFPQFQVVGNKIYYVCQQPDESKNRQIWTMEMNIDGTGWKELQRTYSPYDKVFPQLQVINNKIYYTWSEFDGKYRQIWTAEMNLDGTAWKETKRTISSSNKFEPQFQVVGEKIYLVWREFDGSHFQIWTAMMKRDGTGWEAVKRTMSPQDKHNPKIKVDGKKIYFTWHQADGPDSRKAKYQVWTAEMNIDGSDWAAIQRTFSPFDKYTPQLQVFRNKIYYIWEESDGKYRQIWTASVNKDGSGWISEKRTRSSYGKYDPQFQIVGNKIYYVWHEDHGEKEPIYVSIEDLTF